MPRTLLFPIAAASLLIASAPASAQPATQPAPLSELVSEVDIPYETFTLDNGLRVIVHTDRKARATISSRCRRSGPPT
jgi:hypothetical protein